MIQSAMPPRVHIMMTYLVLLSSSRSDQNIGRRVVSIWHGRWQYLSRHSHQHPVCCRNNLPSVCLAMSTLVFQPSSCHLLHIMARLAGLVVGSRRMCPTNRLRRVATVSCSAAWPVRAILWRGRALWSRHEMPMMRCNNKAQLSLTNPRDAV